MAYIKLDQLLSVVLDSGQLADNFFNEPCSIEKFVDIYQNTPVIICFVSFEKYIFHPVFARFSRYNFEVPSLQ